jgi:hypothetical protein
LDSFVILIPVYNDWEAAGLLLRQIDSVCAGNGLNPAVLLINDGSTLPVPDDLLEWQAEAFSSLDILELHKNLGHQRAICVGMVYVSENLPEAALLIMDADGEDPASEIPTLIQAYLERGGRRAVFAARRRRTEGLVFKGFYQLYRLLHLLLVGFDIRIGNFSMLPPSLVTRLVRSSDLWNHYAACAVKSKLPIATIPIDRAKRLTGQSKMSFTSLALHGLSAMSVYSDVIGIRIVVLTAIAVLLGFATLTSVVVIRSFTHWAIPGWATNVFGITLMLICQAVIISLLFTFGVLASRGGQTFIPVRDCPHFVLNVRRLFTHVSDHLPGLRT